MGWFWKCHLVVLILKYWSFFSVAVVTVNASTPKILSVTRSSSKGDSFDMELESYGCPSCQQYGAVPVHVQGNVGETSTCSCYCSNETKPTFYTTRSGQHGCVKDSDILADTHGGDTCDFYIDRSQQLKVLDLHVNGNARLKPSDLCDRIEITGWKFYFNTSWILFASGDALFTSNIKKEKKNQRVPTFFYWDGNLNSFFKGLLTKVMFRCTYKGKTDSRCLMLKAEGTHWYYKIPTTTPPVYEPTFSIYTSTKNSNVQISTKEHTETSNPLATGGYSKANDKHIWIAVSLGLSGLILIVIIAIVVFLVLKCRRNCKQERTGSRRHPPEHPPESAVCPPLHDYEYVHYPCLVDGIRSPPKTPLGNPMYERGEDNKLIIWAPGHSGTLTRSAEASAPRLPYQRLLTRTSSSSPDCTTGVRPVSSPGVESNFPYQKLVRAVVSLPRTTETSSCSPDCTTAVRPVSSANVEEAFPYQKLVRSVPSLQREASRCGHMEESEVELGEEEVSTDAYQSLSLQRNQPYPSEECDGYAKVDGVPDSQSENLEYDYALVELDPVELRKLFRISHSEDDEIPSSFMEITIGDLNNTATSPKSHVRKTSSSSPCSGDYENCTCEDIEEKNCPSCAHRNGESFKSKDLRPAVSYEDLSGGCPEEYVEMGKRKSVMIVEDQEPTETEEDNGHEYFVLEAVVESDEGGYDDGKSENS